MTKARDSGASNKGPFLYQVRSDKTAVEKKVSIRLKVR